MFMAYSLDTPRSAPVCVCDKGGVCVHYGIRELNEQVLQHVVIIISRAFCHEKQRLHGRETREGYRLSLTVDNDVGVLLSALIDLSEGCNLRHHYCNLHWIVHNIRTHILGFMRHRQNWI
jgi:hypothetical protein